MSVVDKTGQDATAVYDLTQVVLTLVRSHSLELVAVPWKEHAGIAGQLKNEVEEAIKIRNNN